MIQTIHELNIAPQAQGDTHNVRKEIQFEMDYVKHKAEGYHQGCGVRV